VAEVRGAYFELVATQAAVDNTGRSQTLEEARRVATEYEAQNTRLHADVLAVDARMTKALYELSVAENGLATQRLRASLPLVATSRSCDLCDAAAGPGGLLDLCVRSEAH
jgi:hypothetical protein